MALEFTGPFGKVRIYNIYNPCESDHMLLFLERHMSTEYNQRCTTQGGNTATSEHIIWLGNFNCHHPMWEMSHNTHLFTAANLNAVGVLINLLVSYNLVQVLPPAIATLEASNTMNHTRPDNIFCSSELENRFTKCKVEYHLRPVVTDHFHIISSLNLQPE
jgi:hypothetical protein